jgi:chromosome segregation ATPase
VKLAQTLRKKLGGLIWIRGYYNVKQEQQPHEDLRGDLRELLNVLQDNRSSIAAKLEQLDNKLETVPAKLELMRRDSAEDLRVLENKLTTLFVPRSEYEPRHLALVEKTKEYDRIIADSQKTQQEYVLYKSRVDTLEERLQEMKNRQDTMTSRFIPWVGAAIALVSFIINFVQHVQIK